MAGYLSYRLVALLSRALPRYFAYFCGIRLADTFFFAKKWEREAVMRNLKQVYSFRGAEVSEHFLRQLARKAFQHFGKYLVDFFRFHSLSRQEAVQLVAIENRHHLHQALERGRGVVAVTAHFGNWEMGGSVLHAMGYSIHAVFLPMATPRLDRLFLRQRVQRGIELIPVGHTTRLLRILRDGHIVALLGDRDLAGKSARVPFFGREAELPRGPARLAMISGAALLPSFIYREPHDAFVLRFHRPLWPESHRDEQRLLEFTAAAMEREISERPFQWFIFEDFWDDARRRKKEF
ncbi:MAG TPA: hypothetical protein EYP62_08580 [Kiritimatiellae bacterium]|nr:hypothetical protein [Kiritimatiellia bacterium]